MVATTVTVQSPPSGIDLPDGTDGILRPRGDVEWTGGTGPFNVKHEWDTANTFDTGNLISQTNTSVTSPDSEVPLSDLGDGTETAWYYRATVIDTGDSNAELASSIHTINYTLPRARKRYLYQQVAPTVAFDEKDSPLEIQLIYNDATGGTFTLSFDGQGPTASINYNDTAATIKTRLESLSNITTVDVDELNDNVIRGITNAWRVTFIDPGGESEPLITASDSLTGGSTTILQVFDGGDWDVASPSAGTVGADGQQNPSLLQQTLYQQVNVGVAFEADTENLGDDPTEVQIIYHDGTGGSFTLSFDGQGPTSAITWNAAPSAVESALELLSNITSVRVTDGGVRGRESWRVEFLDPSHVSEPLITIDDTNLTGDTVGGVVYQLFDGGDWGTTGGGTAGTDGEVNPSELKQFLALQTNLGVSNIDTDQDRFLALQLNVDTTQPCPHIHSIFPTVAKEGDAIVITGQGLVSATKPTADAYGAEVRLYASADFADTYVTMAITDYTAGETTDTITATVPTGATNGHVAVVHTVTPSCTGSNFKFLTVVAGEPDPDAGWWIEVWNLRATAKIIARLPIETGTAGFQKINSDIGSGFIELPSFVPDPTDATKNLLDEISDPNADPKVETLVRVYLDGILRYGFFARHRTKIYSEVGQGRSRIYGPGRESAIDWAIIEPSDFGLSEFIESPDVIFGSTDNIVGNGTADDGPDPVSNGSFEEASLEPWEPTGTGGHTLTGAVARTGAFSQVVQPAAADDGARASISVEPGKRFFFEGYVRAFSTTGETVKLDMYWEDSDSAQTSLDTDTAVMSALWQRLAVSAVIPDGVTSIFLEFSNTSGSDDFYIDDVAGAGSISPWISSAATVRLTDTIKDGGTYSFEIISGAIRRGARQIMSASGNTKYTFTARMAGTATEKARLRVTTGGTSVDDEQTFASTNVFQTFTVTVTTGDDDRTIRLDLDSMETGGSTLYADNVTGFPGEPAGSGGTVIGKLLTDAQARGTIPFFSWNFTATLDSNGETWDDDELTLTLRHGRPISHALDQLVAFGLEWEVTDAYELRLVNRLGADLTLVEDLATVLDHGKPIVDGDLASETPRATVVYAEGAGGTNTSADKPTWTSALERREKWIVNDGTTDSVTLAKLANATLDEEEARGRSVKIMLVRSDPVRPFIDFDVGDSVFLDLPDENIPKDAYRVVSIQVRMATETDVVYTVDFNRLEYEQAAAQAAALQRLIEKGDDTVLSSSYGTVGLSGSTGPGGGGGSTGGGSDDHQHTLPGALTNPETSGDITGPLPGPLFVTAIRGLQFALDTVNDGDAYIWDNTKKLFVPQSPAVTLPGGTKGDILVHNGTAYVAVGVGIDGKVLGTDSADAEGVVWVQYVTTKGDLLAHNGTIPIRKTIGTDDYVLTADSTAAAGFEWKAIPTVVYDTRDYAIPGAFETGTGVLRLPIIRACTITNIRVMCDEAPTTTDAIFDVNKNIDDSGATIFTTQANRPTISAGTNDSGNAVPDVTALAAGDYLTVDIDQTGTGTVGSDATLAVEVTIP